MKKMTFFAAAMAMLLLTACAENPDADIIVHKDLDKLIDEAQQTGESKAEVVDLQQYDHYAADLTNEGLHVKVHADADVDIPQTDKLSVFRVKQHDFTNEDVEKFRRAFFGDAAVYDAVHKEPDRNMRVICAHIAQTILFLSFYIVRTDCRHHPGDRSQPL